MIVAYLVFTTLATNWRIVDPPLDERERHRRQHQGDRQPAQFRDRQIFRRRGARGGALRQVDGALRAPERAHLCLAGGAQRRAGGDLHHRPGRRDGDVRRRHSRSGRNTVGDFVLINVMMLQLYQPLNFMGMVYREIKQAIVDIELMFDILEQNPEIEDRPGARRARCRRRRGALRECRVQLRPGAPDPERRVVRGAGGQDGRHRRPLGRRQIDDLAAAVPLLRAVGGPHHHRRAGHRAT